MSGPAPTAERVRELLSAVTDPEIPVLSLADLGVLRDVAVDGGHVTVTLTPTFSGCPAMDEMRADVRSALARHGLHDVEVRTVLSPAWTTDDLSAAGRERLRAYGIAPPRRGPSGAVPVALGRRTEALECPQCGSHDTEELSRYGSTSCKSLWRCRSCREPFEHLKDH